VRLRFAMGPIPEVGPATDAASQAASPPPAPTAEDALEAHAAAAVIDDPDLRALVARAAGASLAKTRSGRHF